MSKDKGVYIVNDGVQSFVTCEPGVTSDGYHTFDELYEHRCLLFCSWADMADMAGLSMFWKSWRHGDGTPVYEGWFIAGTNQACGKQITYHLPASMWDLFHAQELEQSPEFDGHSSQDVLTRLKDWLVNSWFASGSVTTKEQGLGVRESLSELSHEIWSSWMHWQFSICKQNEDGSITIPPTLVNRWKRQIKTPYHDLSDQEKNSDREQADKIIQVLEQYCPNLDFSKFESIAVQQLAIETRITSLNEP